MADRPAQVLEVVARLRTDGHRVELVPGWETRGKAPMTTRGRIEHHTATPRGAAGDAPTLRVVTFGHGSLRNSLSRWYVSRRGIIYLIALNTSWHAGAGGKGTNGTLSGTEAEHSGTAGERWSPESLDAQAAISRHEAAVFGFPTSRVWEHREHAPARKVDRAHIDGAAWRARLAEPAQEDIMATIEEVRAVVAAENRVVLNRVNEATRLATAAATSAVAQIRTELGLKPDPTSDAVHVRRIREGTPTERGTTYDLAEVRRRLEAKSAAEE